MNKASLSKPKPFEHQEKLEIWTECLRTMSKVSLGAGQAPPTPAAGRWERRCACQEEWAAPGSQVAPGGAERQVLPRGLAQVGQAWRSLCPRWLRDRGTVHAPLAMLRAALEGARSPEQQCWCPPAPPPGSPVLTCGCVY